MDPAVAAPADGPQWIAACAAMTPEARPRAPFSHLVTPGLDPAIHAASTRATAVVERPHGPRASSPRVTMGVWGDAGRAPQTSFPRRRESIWAVASNGCGRVVVVARVPLRSTRASCCVLIAHRTANHICKIRLRSVTNVSPAITYVRTTRRLVCLLVASWCSSITLRSTFVAPLPDQSPKGMPIHCLHIGPPSVTLILGTHQNCALIGFLPYHPPHYSAASAALPPGRLPNSALRYCPV